MTLQHPSKLCHYHYSWKIRSSRKRPFMFCWHSTRPHKVFSVGEHPKSMAILWELLGCLSSRMISRHDMDVISKYNRIKSIMHKVAEGRTLSYHGSQKSLIISTVYIISPWYARELLRAKRLDEYFSCYECSSEMKWSRRDDIESRGAVRVVKSK